MKQFVFSRPIRFIVVPALILLGVMALDTSLASVAHAAGIVVNDAGDTTGACATTGTGTCTLRDAITFANSNAGPDTITFNIPSGGACSSANTCTITLGSSPTAITTDVTIDGAPGNGHITLSGNDLYRIMVITGGTTNLNALTFERGSAQGTFNGGAILSSSFSGTTTLNISNSTFSRNHTAIDRSTAGGAIFSRNTILNVTNSTFSGNYSSTSFAALGGAIYNENATATITNSTFSGNSAASGGAIATGSGGTTALKNTIIANSPDGGNCNGSISADDYNIADDATCNNASQFSTAAIALGALADNGGWTWTMAIDENSVAFGYGDNTVCAAAPVNNLDQRGQTRPQGVSCDTGAYEFVYSGWQTGPNFVVNSAADTEDGSCDVLGQGIFNQDCTLREAILAANARGGADTITFNIPSGGACSSANTCTVMLGGALPIMTDATTINGAPNSGRITVNGAGSYTIFDVENDFNLNALTVANGAGLLKSGGLHIDNPVSVTVSNSTFVGNRSATGGHLKNSGGATVTIVNSTFYGSSSTGIGNLGGGTLTIYNSTIDGNNQSGSRGISNTGGTVTLYNTIAANNEGDNCSTTAGTVTADASNIADDATCGSATQKTSAEINLQALADNGGHTQTVALGTGSAAFDAGNDAVCAAAPVNGLDQRGVARPQGPHCDVGAFESEAKGTITFVKKTEGGDGVFSFSSPQLGSFRLATQKKTAQRIFANLTPGSYSASEIPTKGWDLTRATCSDGSNPASINLAPGEQVTCNFTNAKRGAITVVKNSTGGDALFPFASQTLGGFDLTTVGGTAQRVFSNLVAGTYDLSENTPAGWTQTAATCSDGSSPASVNVAAGEEVTCTFTNVKQGSLTVVKQATGSDATFAFSSTALGAFDLTTVNGTASRVFANLSAGVYDVSETVPAGWRLDRATCSDGSIPPNVDVAAGEDVTCTFENSQLDTIVIVKLAIGGDGVFPFVSQALGSFTMTTTAGTEVQAFSGLAPGVYDVTESAVAGWTQAEADPQCSNGNRASSITLAAGETVVCIFANLKQDTIVVEKRTVGGDGNFTFSSNLPGAASFALATVNGAASRAFDNLPPATYSISEAPQAGWAQTGASCSGGSDPSSINLAPGATVRCIFTDTKLSNITVVKQAVGGDGSFGFTGSLGTFNLSTAGGTAQRTFANLLPGSYRITETVPSGWSLTGAGCADGSNPGSITLAAGRDLTCTFVDTKGGSLTTIVNVTNGNGSFGFTSTALGNFFIVTSGGTGQKSFANLAPGVYDLNEVVTSGWDAGTATCSNGSNPATVSVAAGETVTCTFENSADGTDLYMPLVSKR